MRIIGNPIAGVHNITVLATPIDVDALAASWPCSGLNPTRGATFEFEARNGDLCDHTLDGR